MCKDMLKMWTLNTEELNVIVILALERVFVSFIYSCAPHCR